VTVRHDQTSPQLEHERHGGVFRLAGVPPRDHGPGGADLPPPGRLSRRVMHILNTNAPGSRLAPFLYPHEPATPKGTA
jgi:hypothetical protein